MNGFLATGIIIVVGVLSFNALEPEIALGVFACVLCGVLYIGAK